MHGRENLRLPLVRKGEVTVFPSLASNSALSRRNRMQLKPMVSEGSPKVLVNFGWVAVRNRFGI